MEIGNFGFGIDTVSPLGAGPGKGGFRMGTAVQAESGGSKAVGLWKENRAESTALVKETAETLVRGECGGVLGRG